MDPKKIIERSAELFTSTERSSSEQTWKLLLEFMLNNQSGIINGTTSVLSAGASAVPGSKKTSRLFDSTAMQAVQELASAFQGTLTNPATVWSQLRFTDEALNNDESAVNWLAAVNKAIHQKLNESNFNTEIAKAYQSFVALANMALLHEEDEMGNFRFTAVHLGQIAWAEDRFGIVDTVYRKFSLTAYQAFQRWDVAVGDDILKALDKNPNKEFEFLHAIFPRDKGEVKLNEWGLAAPANRPIASVYINMKDKSVLENGGYYEMPMYIGRWGLMPGERYGRGPSHLALPDVRTLNKLKELALRSVAKQVDPPILANQRDLFGQLDMRPATLSVVKDVRGIVPFQTAARNDVMQVTVEDLKASIRSIFFLDKLLLPPRTETGEMTAFEVSQRIEQMQRVLGPVLSRMNNELLNPLIVRSFRVLLRSGLLPEMPPILVERGVDIDIAFVNQLARAQQIQDVTTIQQWVQGLAMIAQMDPSVIDNINADGIARHMAKIMGVPEEAVQNSDVVQQVRQQRAEAQQQAMQLQAGVQMADINSKLSSTQK